MKVWNKEDLKGTYTFTYKLDGVQAIKQKDKWVSRAGKSLYNLPKTETIASNKVEVFFMNWEKTIHLVRSQSTEYISPAWLYSLEPLDSRLIITTQIDPSKEYIEEQMQKALDKGYEGLVLHGPKIYKVKTIETYDVPIIGIQKGKGKFKGLVGAFHTPMGKVGTGFTAKQRQELLTTPNNTIIEVACMQLTKEGKFRHPRFIRVREDK